jgi:lysozyme
MNNKVIDLSHHNLIAKDLIPARDAGVRGVIHKLTEGTVMTDTTAKARYFLAQQAGLLWGLYHFMRPGDPKKQADFFIKQATQHQVIDNNTLMVCDFEVGNISLVEALAFMQAVERATGRIPMLYSGHTLKELGGCHACPPLARYRLWLSQYGPEAELPKGYDHYWLWQNSETGKIPGIGGKGVDLNHFDGSDDELIAQWAGRII